MSARAAVTTAERYTAGMRALEHYARQRLGDLLTADGLLDEAAVEQQYGRVGVQTAYTALQNATIRRVWQQHRIVYDIHPSLWAELGETDTDAVLPADLFTRLPHPDPFIAFPEPLVMPLGEDTRQRIHGLFVYGTVREPDTGRRRVASTSDRTGVSLELAFGGEKERLTGAPVIAGNGLPDMAWGWVSADPTIGDHTVGAMISASLTEISGSTDLTIPDWQDQLARLIRRAVSLLVYLCATNADLTPLPRQSSTGVRRPATKKTKNIGPKPSTPVGVGYRIGAALAAHHARGHTLAAEPTGRTVAPHVRRAHFHTYKVGPGRQETQIKWLSPIPVNVHGDTALPTVIGIPQRAHR